MTPVSVAIVNYNTRELLRDCLRAVVREAPVEIAVVDNASRDGSAEMVRADFPGITLHTSGVNTGYGAAANRAVLNCTAAHVFLLNSDAFVRPGALNALSTYLDQHPRAAVVGPRLVSPDGALQRSCYPFPVLTDVFLDVSNLNCLIGHVPLLRDRYLRTWRHTHARQVPWLTGAAMLIRREAFESVGGFDPSYFMYYEEVDLCYRLKRTGWQIHFAPVTDIIHVGGASTRQLHADMAVQLYAALVHFYRRHYPLVSLYVLVALLECVALGRLLRDTVTIRFSRDVEHRARLAARIVAWQRLLAGRWRRQVSGG